MEHVCPFCSRQFPSLASFIEHTQAETGLIYCENCDCWGPHDCNACVRLPSAEFLCMKCVSIFESSNAFFEHPCIQQCRFCANPLDEGNGWEHFCPHLYEHRIMEIDEEQRGGGERGDDQFDIEESHMFNGASHTVTLRPRVLFADLGRFFTIVHPYVYHYVTNDDIHDKRTFIQISIRFEKEDHELDELREIDHTFSNNARTVNHINFDTWWTEEVTTKIDKDIDTFSKEGSGWRIQQVLKFVINMSANDVHGGRGKMIHVPPILKSRNTRWIRVLNVYEDDGNCFKDAILFSLAAQDDALKSKLSNLRSIKELRNLKLNDRYHLDFEGLDDTGLFRTDKIHEFEKKNNMIVRCYVHSMKGFKGPLYINRKELKEDTRIVHIMLLSDIENDMLNGHYFPIVNFTMMAKYYYKEKFNVAYRAGPVCAMCLRIFPPTVSTEEWEQHRFRCGKLTAQFEKMPKDPILRFQDHARTTQPMNVLYADIEAIIQPDKKGPIHTAAFIGSYLKWHDQLQHHETHEVNIDEGSDCVEKFMKRIERIVVNNIELLKETTQTKIHMTTADEIAFANAKACEICDDKISKENKCRDHDHITGKYLQALCVKCNFRRQQTRRKLAVFFHNWKGYDSHQIILHGISKLDPEKWDVFPTYQQADKTLSVSLKYKMYSPTPLQMTEGIIKHMRPTLYQVVFRDSFQFLSSSLDKLAKNLEDTPITRNMMKQQFGFHDLNIFSKGIFPYTYFNAWEKLKETQLPPIQCFYNDLTDQPCSQADYENAKRTWERTDCKTLRDYLVLYLALDVGLLTDIFEDFRRLVYEVSQLEAIHYCGIPGLTYSFCFKYCKLQLQALQDPTMYTFFESGIRGGMTFVNKHKAERELPSEANDYTYTHLFDCDANNLYGAALSSKLPHSKFEWMDEEALINITDEFMTQWDPEQEEGFVVDVDLYYPPECQDQTMDLPLAPIPDTPKEEDHSPFMKSLWAEYQNGKKYIGGEKLLLTHKDKKHYVLHHGALKYYVSKGLQIRKVHKGITFYQEAYIKPYADFHTSSRAVAKNDAAKNMHKLFMNSLFGKTMENVRNYKRSKLVRNKKMFLKYTHHPMAHQWFKIFDHAMVVSLLNNDIELNKAIYIGMTVLECSKIQMYKMFDQWLSNPLIKHVQLIGGDTDSYFLQVKSKYPRDDILRYFVNFPNTMDPNAHGVFDSSNYPTTHPLFSNANKARLGCFKDEACGAEIQEFICLCPKMYSFIKVGGEVSNRAKGVKKSKKDTLSHDNYREVYESRKSVSVNQTFLRSQHHVMRTVSMTKRALSVWEDKRCWINRNESVPYGHHKLFKENGFDTAAEYVVHDCE